jgi:hypothetical protein
MLLNRIPPGLGTRWKL